MRNLYVYVGITWGNNRTVSITALSTVILSSTIYAVIGLGKLWPLKLPPRTTLPTRHSNHLQQVTIRNGKVPSPNETHLVCTIEYEYGLYHSTFCKNKLHI